MTAGKHRIKSHMTLDFEFAGIRVQETTLTPVDWKLKVNLVAPERKGKSKEEQELEAGVAYQKILFWLETNLHSIVAVNVEDEDDLYIANLSSNIMLYCPGPPNDDIIAQMLHAKITALSENYLLVGDLQLQASDASVQYTFDSVDGTYDLPTKTEDYYTEGETRHTVPWWHRNDGFSFEIVKLEPDEEGKSDFPDITDPLSEFAKHITEIVHRKIGVVQEPAKIVQVERWRPKKV